MKIPVLALLLFVVFGCNSQTNLKTAPNVSLIVLGTAQDGGSPHIGCKKECCKALFENPDPTRKVVSLGVVDHQNNKTFLFEATPDMTEQLKVLKNIGQKTEETPDGIFLTHAHIGHYTGLMFLGREALGSKNVKVFAMPKMKSFIETNGPWSQLVSLQNIALQKIKEQQEIKLTENLTVIPFTVPHRDEFSETVGYKIIGPTKSALFIPDIDKWSKWETAIIDEIKKVDFAFLDATFFDGEEINTRNIAEIPHPFVVESMALFDPLPKSEKEKIHFIHFNHTNPLLNTESDAFKTVRTKGYKVATYLEKVQL